VSLILTLPMIFQPP